MSNISLLMVSVLTAGLPSVKELPHSPQPEAEDSSDEISQLEKEQEIQSFQAQSSPIAPPETLYPEINDSDTRFEIKSKSNLPRVIPTEKDSLNIPSQLRPGISPPEIVGAQIINSETINSETINSETINSETINSETITQNYERSRSSVRSQVSTQNSELTIEESQTTVQNRPHSDEQTEIKINRTSIDDRKSKLDLNDRVGANKTQKPNFLINEVTSVSQLDDIKSDDWAFGALQSLIERYGCIPRYKDGTYGAKRAIDRYEFAADLATCLQRINQLIAKNNNQTFKEEDLLVLQRLETDFQKELQQLEKRVENLEERTTQLKAKEFSPNTKLFGQVILSLQGNNSPKVDLFPRDGQTERQAKSNLSFTNSVQLTLATSFTGKDLLLTGLSAGNLGSSAPLVFNNMGRLGHESDTNNDVVLNELSYRFAVSENLGFVVGTRGVNTISTFRGINPLEGSGKGAISLFGQRNPILAVGNGRSGVGFDWQISDRVSLQGIYNTETASFPGNNNDAGLFNGRYTTGAQLSLAPTDNVNVGLHYLYSHSPDASLGTGIGDAQLVSPFAPITEFDTQAAGATIAWRINPNLEVGGWGGWTYSDPKNLSGSVQTTNWAMFAALPNLGKAGNLGGVIIGQPPKITSSSLPDGFNFPNFSDGGISGGRKGTSLHVELFYNAQVNQNLSLTPGFFVVFNPDHNQSNEPLVVGALRATYQF